MFNEQSLYNDIVDKWGEHGAHADVFRAMQAELTRLTVAYNGLWDKVNELVETSGEIERLGEYIEELRSDRFEWVKTAQKQEAEIERLRAVNRNLHAECARMQMERDRFRACGDNLHAAVMADAPTDIIGSANWRTLRDNALVLWEEARRG